MITRYTEQARQVLLFARYEAAQFGTSYIETEHLLLGLAREDKILMARLSGSNGGLEVLRKQIESRVPPRQGIPTTADMPLSRDCLWILKAAGKEADKLEEPYIASGHLLLALLRVEAGLAEDLLRQRGIDYATYYEMFCGRPMPQAGDDIHPEPTGWEIASSTGLPRPGRSAGPFAPARRCSS